MTNIAVRNSLRLAAVLALALGAGACSTIASLDPTGLLSDDSSKGDSSGTTPDLSNVPDKPNDASTPDDQKQVAQSLAADGTQTQYSADALRAGTETAAAPPPPASAVTPPPADSAAPPPDDSTPQAAPPPDDTASASPAPPPPPAPPPVAAAAPPPSGAEPAVPRNSGPHTRMAMASPSDAQLGFKPSAAPPLDPSITQWVQPSIVAHYRQTAENAGIAGSVPSGPAGAVVPGKMDRNRAIAMADGGVMPEAVIYFPGDGTTITAAARAEIRAAIKAYNAAGSQGTIRIVGHASSRTANMPVEKHLMLIFKKSQARADAVAREVIRAGVPAANVLVDAVGDSQPVYYESMPKGEDGNRRAEIFFQK